jgi:AcrR family transcriptional regulator
VTGDRDLDGAATGAGRRGRPRDASADERILQAAVQLLLERGYDRMTIDEVAESAGVAKATVYRRYLSKEDLAAGAMRRLFDVEIPVPDTGSIRSDLEQVYTNLLTFARSPQGTAFLRLAAAECCRDERVATLYRQMILSRLEHDRVVVDRAIERGEVRADVTPDVLFDWLPGLVILRVLANRQLPDLDDVGMLVEMALHGIAPGRVAAAHREPGR